MSAHAPLLVVIDPLARTVDGESVRIARDVLRAGADSLKICLPESAAEWDRVLRYRGRRRPVVVGDDAALLRTLRALYREGALGEAALSFVPVGRGGGLSLAGRLGVPRTAAPAARAALDGAERALDLLVDDSGGLVVGTLRIPGAGHGPAAGPDASAGGAGRDGGPGGLSDPGGAAGGRTRLERGARSLARALAGSGGPHSGHRLRVEADGVLLADLDRPVREVAVVGPVGGLAVVSVRRPRGLGPLTVPARQVTVSGPDFRYRADEAVSGPVRRRTWTVHAAAWHLTLPAG